MMKPNNGPDIGVYDFLSTGELQSGQKLAASEGDLPGILEKGASQRARLTGANKRMFNLLRKAKVQLIKIDQQKQLKSSGVRSSAVFIVFHCSLLHTSAE